jgi:hypothetical protein
VFLVVFLDKNISARRKFAKRRGRLKSRKLEAANE